MLGGLGGRGSFLGGGDGPNLAMVAACTALVAGVMTLLMGVVANYPLALAAGLGLNAFVACTHGSAHPGGPHAAGFLICRICRAVAEADLAAYLDGKLSRYKMPKRFLFWDALPKSAYGKITKKMIRAELEARGMIA